MLDATPAELVGMDPAQVFVTHQAFHAFMEDAFGALLQEQRYVEAERLLRNAVRLDEQLNEAHGALAGLLADLGRSGEQYEAAQRWIACQPSCGEAHMELAKACHELRKPEETLRYYRRAIELERAVRGTDGHSRPDADLGRQFPRAVCPGVSELWR